MFNISNISIIGRRDDDLADREQASQLQSIERGPGNISESALVLIRLADVDLGSVKRYVY